MAEITNNLQLCANFIKTGGIVSFPTETVYGLGASIYDINALDNIFKIKNRPYNNPLIVHIYKFDQLRELVDLDESQLKVLKDFTDKLWPGPISIILPKSKKVNNLVSGNTEFVGIRIPANEISLEFLKKCDVPIAAPSANKYCHVSSVTWEHVKTEFLKEKIKIIPNNKDEFSVGIESTIISINFSSNLIEFLRPGFITKNIIQSIIKNDINLCQMGLKYKNCIESVPGSSTKHYAINKNTYLLEYDCEMRIGENTSFLDFGDTYKNYGIKNYYTLSESSNFLEAMQNLYSLLWTIEQNNTNNLIIFLPKIDNQFYNSLYNRIIKCCSGNVLSNGYGIGKN